MAKCYMTGVEFPIEEAYLIDLGPAYRLLQQLRHQASTVERLIAQLGPRDQVDVYDPVKKKAVAHVQLRLVSPAMSKVLGEIYPEKPLFIKWAAWKSRKATIKQQVAGNGTIDDNGTGAEAIASQHQGTSDDSGT